MRTIFWNNPMHAVNRFFQDQSPNLKLVIGVGFAFLLVFTAFGTASQANVIMKFCYCVMCL